MQYCLAFFALSCALLGPERSVAQQGPTPKTPPPEASQFDFLVGEWTVDVASKSANAPPRYRGVRQARKTLNGLGIVNEYAVGDDANQVVYSGTTLRAFDTKTGTWTMRYIDQFGGQTGRWSELVGTKDGQEIHVEQRGRSADGRTTILKIRYFDIQPNHFTWTADYSSDGGATWERDYLRIEATRRASTSSGK